MESLIKRFKTGDQIAFKTLFDNFFYPACAFVKKYIHDNEAVEDVVQDTFIQIWDKREQFTDIIFFKAYLYKSLYNNSLYHLRQKKSTDDLDLNIKDDTVNVLETIITNEVYSEIISAVNKLPKERKNVIVLSMQGFTNEQISVQSGVSINTIKTQKKSAYTFLREELKNLFVFFLFIINL